MIKIKRRTQPIKLSEFAQEYGEEDVIVVWVNPSREVMQRYEKLRMQSSAALNELKQLSKKKDVSEEQKLSVSAKLEAVTDTFYSWYAEVWSSKTNNLTPEEVREFGQQCQDQDPALWLYMTTKTIELIKSHRISAKKG